MNIHGKFETPGSFGCPREVEKNELFSEETYHFRNFRYESLKSSLLKKLSVSHILTSLRKKKFCLREATSSTRGLFL